MNHRRVNLGRAGHLLLLLCLLLAGCGSLTRTGPIDPALAAYVSPDAVALAGVRMEQLRTTPIYRKLAQQNRLRFDEFRTESGFDPSRDIREVLLASDGKSLLAIARGTFTGPPAGARDAGEYKGYQLFTRDAGDAIVFIDRNIALAGPAQDVRAAIDQAKGHSGGLPRDLMARVRALPAAAQIWAVVAEWKGATPDQLRQMGNLGNVDRILRSVDGASLTVDLRTGVHAAVTGDCRTEDGARNLADSLRGLTALGRMSMQRNPDLEQALSAIQVKQDGRVVQLNADIPEDLADRLLR
ncbi:MAG TPA: hypothetical protein VMG35_27445 [Bryobacteraceae bacterium]|nr:hypothetical protein [Bryobacteraceae bacterium]